MEAVPKDKNSQSQTKKKPLPKINGRVCNELLLCRKADVEEKIGSIHLTTEDGGVDLRDHIQKKAEVVLVAPRLIQYMDEFNVGDFVTYPTGTREMKIWIDGEEYFFLHKKDIVYVSGS